MHLRKLAIFLFVGLITFSFSILHLLQSTHITLGYKHGKSNSIVHSKPELQLNMKINKYPTFERVPGSNFWMYNYTEAAVYGLNQNYKKGVLVLGFLEKNDKIKVSHPQLYCHLSYNSGPTEIVSANVEHFIHPDVVLPFKFIPSLVWCLTNHSRIPSTVLLSCKNINEKNVNVLNAQLSRSKLLHVHVPEKKTSKGTGLCMQYMYNISLKHFIEFMEMYKLLGVDKFIIHGHGVISKDIKKAMSFYQKSGHLEFLPWNIGNWTSGSLMRSKGEVYVYGSQLFRTNCLHRYLGTLQYMVFVDMDEILIPTYSSNVSITDIMTHVRTIKNLTNLCSAQFPWIFFTVPDAYVTGRNKNTLFTETYTKRCKIGQLSSFNFKSVVNVDLGYTMFTHFILKCRAGENVNYKNDMTIAKIQHYRHGRKMGTCNIQDIDATRYAANLRRNIDEVLRTMNV